MTAKRTGKRAERTAELDTEQETEETPQTDSERAAEELQEIADQLPQGAMLTLWRLQERGEKEFVDEQPVADFTIAAVARQYGGGQYVIYLRTPHPDIAGKWVRKGSKRFRIVGPPRYNVPNAAAGAGVAGVPGAGDVEKLMQTYGELIQATVKSSIDNQQLLQQMQLAVVKSLSERGPDTSLELLKTLIPALIGRGASSAPSLGDVIALADKMANRNSPSSQLKDTLELVEAARKLGGGGDDAPPWMGLAERAVGLIGKVAGYNPAELTPTPTPAAPAQPLPAAVEVHQVAPTAHPLLRWLAPQIAPLMRHAIADHDPDTYAGVICDQILPEHWPDVLAFLQAPDFPAQLELAFPAIGTTIGTNGTVRDWFLDLRDAIVQRLQELMTPPAAGAGEEPEVTP